MDLVKKNPGTAIPVVLSRLQQKDSEWRKVKQDMKPLFGKVFQQNYHKSLDHRSFYFKQTDKKTLGHKSMIQVSCALTLKLQLRRSTLKRLALFRPACVILTFEIVPVLGNVSLSPK